MAELIAPGADLAAGLHPSTLLAGLAAVLLVFVSLGVLYLSTIEWRDRRRRAAAPAGRSEGRGSGRATGRHRRP